MRVPYRRSLAFWRELFTLTAVIYVEVVALLCLFSHVMLWAVTHAVVWVPACQDDAMVRERARADASGFEATAAPRLMPSCADIVDPFGVPGASLFEGS